MSDKILNMAQKFSAEMPALHPFTEVATKQQHRRTEAAMVLLESLAGSKKDVLALCKSITGATAHDVGVSAGELLRKHDTSGTGAASFAKSIILQILVPHLSMQRLVECGMDVGKRSYASAKSRSTSFELPSQNYSTGRGEHASARDISTLRDHPAVGYLGRCLLGASVASLAPCLPNK